MIRRRKGFVWMGVVALCLTTLCSCSDGGQQMYETARFEELQNNPQHARQLYEQIVRDHADSEYAAKARERLAQLSSQP